MVSLIIDLFKKFGLPDYKKPANKLLKWAFPVAVVIYVLSGFYIVKTDELAVIRRFGKVITPDGILPGIHYRFPYPVDQVDTPKTSKVNQVSIGVVEKPGTQKKGSVKKFSEILVGDTNILRVQLNIQYIIQNPSDFLFRSEDPDQLVTILAESELIEIIGKMDVDYVLTVGKIKIQEMTKKKTQEMLDQYHIGVKIIDTNLQSVEPPLAVIEAFNDVSSAKIDRERLINEALGRKSEILPKARGEVHKIKETAKAYALESINMAVGEADRFVSILREYNKSKNITETRIYIEAMEAILPEMKKYIVDADSKTPVDLGFLSNDQAEAPMLSNRRSINN